MTPLHAMRIMGGIELTTLILMLVNLATVHHPAVASALGPVHGLAYIATIIIAILQKNGSHKTWLLALVPGIGGLLAARHVAATWTSLGAGDRSSEGGRDGGVNTSGQGRSG